jgi:hypothetical protein
LLQQTNVVEVTNNINPKLFAVVVQFSPSLNVFPPISI